MCLRVIYILIFKLSRMTKQLCSAHLLFNQNKDLTAVFCRGTTERVKKSHLTMTLHCVEIFFERSVNDHCDDTDTVENSLKI